MSREICYNVAFLVVKTQATGIKNLVDRGMFTNIMDIRTPISQLSLSNVGTKKYFHNIACRPINVLPHMSAVVDLFYKKGCLELIGI